MSKCSHQDTVIPATTTKIKKITQLPNEVQIHILSYLRSYDLSPIQRTCKFYNNPDRIHDVVTFLVHHVYGTEFTEGAIPFPIEVDREVINTSIGNKKKKDVSNMNNREQFHEYNGINSNVNNIVEVPSSVSNIQFRYGLSHLRSIELRVVARVLSLPEPKTGFYVSKSWIKKALLWLELEQQKDQTTNLATMHSKRNPKKKLTKKQQRQKNRRLSDVTPPWPNVNSDLVCEHQKLQRSSLKAARSHRRLMDKKSWKVLRKLYPDSTQLESVSGECLQCLMEAQTSQKNECDKLERDKLLRKQPLSNPHVRRFYTRTRGIPYHCLVEDKEEREKHDQKPKSVSSVVTSSNDGGCPLTSGKYVILPRHWCHQWRRYMKTGDGCKPLPPDSSSLLCDAHKLALLPPHLEAFLNGETSQLFASIKQNAVPLSPASFTSSSTTVAAVVPHSPVGLAQPGRILDPNTRNALIAAGVSHIEMAAQRIAMLQLEEQQQQQQQQCEKNQQRQQEVVASPTNQGLRLDSYCNNELLDRENHAVTELVTHEEWLALQQETGCWNSKQNLLTYCMCVTVENDGTYAFSTVPCRECDPTGLRFTTPCVAASSSIKKNPKFRTKRWEPEHIEQKRIPNLEY